MKKLLIAGCGGIGKKHIEGFLKTGKFKISACDIDNKKLEEIEKKFEIENTYNDFFKVKVEKFDAVLISTPANYHIKMALRCAKKKVPFLVEKPLSVNLKNVDKLLESVKKNRVKCAVGFTRRSIPSFIKFKEIIGSGIIGEIKMAIFYVAQDYRKYRQDYSRIYFAKEKMGGGCILDAVSHFVDLAQWYIGKPSCGYGIYDNLDFGRKVETEDSAAIVSKFNNTIVNFYCNLFQKPYEVFIELAGTKGNLRYISENKHLSEIFFCDNDKGKWKKLQEFENEIKDYYFYQAENFLNLLEGEKDTLTTLKEAIENLKFCLKIKKECL